MAAAQAGYKVAAFDAFNDADTRRFCEYSAAVHYANGGFDAEDLWLQLGRVDPGSVKALVYGSGFESQPALLDGIAQRYPLMGNPAPIVSRVKNPQHFFTTLHRLNIPYPQVQYHLPQDAGNWITKSMGGSGGTHIRRSCSGQSQTGDYFQQRLDGIPVSILFLADGKQAQVVGFNQQWCAPTEKMPYRYGGAVSQVQLPVAVKYKMERAAQGVTAAFGLLGLNSMDFIWMDDEVFALEVNPRLTATFDLYDGADLFKRHLYACGGVLNDFYAKTYPAKAQQIYYAAHDIHIPAGFIWPQWAVNIPESKVKAGQPVCSVLARADTPDAAKSLVFARAQQLEAQLNPFYSMEKPS